MKKVFRSKNITLTRYDVGEPEPLWKLEDEDNDTDDLLLCNSDIKKLSRVCAMFLEEEKKGKKSTP